MMKKFNPDIDSIYLLVSINDIRDKYFEGVNLDQEEALALENYDKFRLSHLNGSKDEKDFDQRYFQLQVMANLYSFRDFLDYENIKA
ncbi:MAG: hypothetical protein R2780_09730 [Crocinitomicaceae bacterium]|nr:hypothetical protein [Crocinitomicaceae bacterium]